MGEYPVRRQPALADPDEPRAERGVNDARGRSANPARIVVMMSAFQLVDRAVEAIKARRLRLSDQVGNTISEDSSPRIPP